MGNGALLYEVRDHIARVTINRPDRRNAMSWDVITGLRKAAADAKEDDDVRVVVLTGRRVGAAEADRMGFVTRVVPVDELDAATDELAADLAAKSPAIVKLGRDSFYAVWDMAAADALAYLHPMLTVTTMTEDAAEGIAAFTRWRPPRAIDDVPFTMGTKSARAGM